MKINTNLTALDMILTFSKSANDLFLLAWATHFSASVWVDKDKKILQLF